MPGHDRSPDPARVVLDSWSGQVKVERLVLANAEAIRQAATLHYEWLIACG